MKIGRVLGGAVVVLVIIPVVAAVATVRLRDPGATPLPPQQAHHVSASSAACPKPAHFRPPLIGVAPGKSWGRKLTRFMQATHVKPQVVAQYLQFGDPYNGADACSVARDGAELLIQWDPWRISLQRIADGGWDQYITQFARDVRAGQLPIVLSFGHEMNGNWYTWGYTKASPRSFIAAWRHLHRLFTAAGARNVTWCWDANTWDPALAGHAPNYGIGPPRLWWPGARYVDWVGLDAYYARPTDTFRTVFQYPLRALHGIAHKPVLIAETAAAAGPWQARQIRTLFSGLRRTNVIGAVWFDGKGRYNWRLEGHPAAIAAFRAGARSLHNG